MIKKKRILTSEMISKEDSAFLDIIKKLLLLNPLSNYPHLIKELHSIQNDIFSKEYRIVVVGEFSSGKSTFLNVFIGKDILPHAKKETTATVTYIRNVPIDDPKCNTITVHKKGESNPIEYSIKESREKLVNVLTFNSDKYIVANEISSVDIYVHFDGIDERMVLVDTPGLNGMTPSSKDITLDEIRKAQACICLFPAKGMSNSEVELIKEIRKYQDQIFFAFNFFDELNSSEGDTREVTLKKCNEDVSNAFFNGANVVRSVFGISALQALVYRDKSIPRLYATDKTELTDEKRNSLWNESNFDKLQESIFAYIQGGQKQKDFKRSISNRLRYVVSTIQNDINGTCQLLDAGVNDVPELHLLLKAKDDIKQKKDRNRENLKNFIKANMIDLEGKAKERISKFYRSQYDEMVKTISKQNLEEIIKEKEGLQKKIVTIWHDGSKQIECFLNCEVSHIWNAAVDELERRMPQISFQKDGEKRISVKVNISSENIFQKTNDRLSQLQSELEQKENEKSKLEHSKRNSVNDHQKKELLEREIQRLKSERETKLRLLGSRPPVEYISKRVKKGGIWNSIKRIFGGGYETITLTDDSKRKKYDSEKQSTINSFKKAIDQKQQEKEELQKLIDKEKDNSFLRVRLEESIDRLKKEIQKEEQVMKEAERIAKSETTKRYKNELNKAAEDNLMPPQGSSYIYMCNDLHNIVDEQTKSMQERLISIFDNKIREYMGHLNLLIKKIENESERTETAIKQREWKQYASDIEHIQKQLNNIAI